VIPSAGDRLPPAERRQRWAEVAVDLAGHLLAGTEPEAALRLLAGQVRELTGADVAVVLAPSVDDPADLTITVAEGPEVDDIEGVRIPLPGTKLGITYATGASRVFEDVRVLPIVGRRAAVVVELTEGYGPAMFVPLGELPGRRLLAVLRAAGSPPFDAGDPERMAACARRCATLLDLARAQERSRRGELQSDRERIARDLHDHVVQRIYAIGLSLDRISRALEPEHPEAAARVGRNVDELDATITDIRTAIFELHRSDILQFPPASERLADVVRQVTEGQPVQCSVRIQGPVDDLPPNLLPDVAAVLRELVTNVVRHARAARATVVVRAGPSTLDVVVTDDGVGLPSVGVRSGLANLADRAERLGGALTTATAPSGTEVRWTVPLLRT
jgi:signal transduction histidine kinase